MWNSGDNTNINYRKHYLLRCAICTKDDELFQDVLSRRFLNLNLSLLLFFYLEDTGILNLIEIIRPCDYCSRDNKSRPFTGDFLIKTYTC